MLTIEQEMQLLQSILQTISDENEYAQIANKIIELNENLKGKSNKIDQ